MNSILDTYNTEIIANEIKAHNNQIFADAAAFRKMHQKPETGYHNYNTFRNVIGNLLIRVGTQLKKQRFQY